MDETAARSDGAPAHFYPDTFEEQLTPGALRYLTQAINPGTAIASRAEIVFSGHVRLKPNGTWMAFRATETIHAGRSFRVTASARRGPFAATIEDSYQDGQARSRVRALGLIPVRSQHGADLARSARGRLVVESTWLPSAFLPSLGAKWSQDAEGDHVAIPIDGDDVQATIHVGPHGEMAGLHLLRWSNVTADGRYGWVPFSARASAHRRFSGYTIPSDITASWGAGTDHEFEFFHATVENVRFSP